MVTQCPIRTAVMQEVSDSPSQPPDPVFCVCKREGMVAGWERQEAAYFISFCKSCCVIFSSAWEKREVSMSESVMVV